jgi:hypothetical protein
MHDAADQRAMSTNTDYHYFAGRRTAPEGLLAGRNGSIVQAASKGEI